MKSKETDVEEMNGWGTDVEAVLGAADRAREIRLYRPPSTPDSIPETEKAPSAVKETKIWRERSPGEWSGSENEENSEITNTQEEGGARKVWRERSPEEWSGSESARAQASGITPRESDSEGE